MNVRPGSPEGIGFLIYVQGSVFRVYFYFSKLRVEGVGVCPVASNPESLIPNPRRLGFRFKTAAERKGNNFYDFHLKLAKARIWTWLLKPWSFGSEAARGLELTSISEPKA